MIIVYCDTCGLRITESDLGHKGAVETSPNSWQCANCAVTVPKNISNRPKTAPTKMLLGASRESNEKAKHSSVPSSVKRKSNNQAALIAVGVTLTLIGILLVFAANRKSRDVSKELSAKRLPTETENSPSTQTIRASTASSATTVSTGSTSVMFERKSAVSDSDPADRVKAANQDITSYRDERAAKLLEELKAWFKQNAADPWEYRDRLRSFVASYRSTPAGNEAVKLLDELKSLPAPVAITVPGRYVRLTNIGTQKFLHLAEIQVFSAGQNVALQGKASQSSVDFGGDAQRAIDGNTNGDFFANSVSHTAMQDDPWWEVDLGQSKDLQSIVIWNRTDGALESRLANFKVEVLDEARKTLWEKTIADPPSPNLEIVFQNRSRP